MAIFTTPFKPSRPLQTTKQPSSHSRPRSKKRKRSNTTHQEENHSGSDDSSSSTSRDDAPNLDYIASLSPLERIQHRLAGLPFDQPVPPPPFPHAPLKEHHSAHLAQDAISTHISTSRSLHFQHLAVLTTIIHRSMVAQDYARASRAMGLLLRDSTVANDAPIRNKGFMGIAAEILLRQNRDPSSSSSAPESISAINLENAKRFYETLIIRHPYHKSWPDSVNAIDFYLALFNIWIYAVSVSGTEHDSTPDSPHSDQLDSQSPAKVRELEQANQIATRMDECMTTLPYMDEPELIRLRAMVDLWLADLYETCHAFAVPLDQVSDTNSLDLPDYFHLAQQSRERAQARLIILEGQPNSSSP
ncbi:hypothetical protein LTR84_006778 [Exophiala bonariae]|uniref:Uncharacterized protein n=1 Tax=Exophiala bonariae TaxID=1690606 RepID=A0AAV9N053_9EURO|nr:hypothetical protein LTR84_006778 [Exophiala bonariae]